MSYYDIDGNLLDIDKEKMIFLNSGKCARILHDDDIIFKEYYSVTEPNYRLNVKVYNVLKDINNPHFMKLLNAYSQMNIFDLQKYKTGIKEFKIDAYTALLYPNEEIDIFGKDKAYLLDNLYELENLLDVFTNNSIIVEDLKRDNVTMDSNSVVIIDPDLFYFSDLPKENITRENKIKLLLLLEHILVCSAIKHPNRREIIDRLGEFIELDVDGKTNITYEFSKKLSYVNKPIDYFVK